MSIIFVGGNQRRKLVVIILIDFLLLFILRLKINLSVQQYNVTQRREYNKQLGLVHNVQCIIMKCNTVKSYSVCLNDINIK